MVAEKREIILKFPKEYDGKLIETLTYKRSTGETLTLVNHKEEGIKTIYPVLADSTGMPESFFREMASVDLIKFAETSDFFIKDESRIVESCIHDDSASFKLLFPIKREGTEVPLEKVEIRMPIGKDLEHLPKKQLAQTLEYVPFWTRITNLESVDFEQMDARDIDFLEKVVDYFL